ncbi:hypothetical protein [Kitasatospora sp. NPDC088783]|uniref:hypothetical protein n=1 Tax=Kitasatospora sp. NPDC088783 TaxID=3364077 RepID=UPI0037F334EF
MAHSSIESDGHAKRRLGRVVLMTLQTDDPANPDNDSVLMVETGYAPRPIPPGGTAGPGAVDAA